LPLRAATHFHISDPRRAGALGFTGIAAGAATLAKIVFVVMLLGVLLVVGLTLFGIITLL
jgi:uncharacterized membrane protein YtjA (UPF0391 family)